MKGPGHNVLMQFSTLGSSKMEFFQTDFCDILTIHNDQTSYVKHFFSPYLGVAGGLGAAMKVPGQGGGGGWGRGGEWGEERCCGVSKVVGVKSFTPLSSLFEVPCRKQ